MFDVLRRFDARIAACDCTAPPPALSEGHLSRSFQGKDAACIVRRRYLQAHALEHLPNERNLLRICFCELPLAQPQRILETDSNV